VGTLTATVVVVATAVLVVAGVVVLVVLVEAGPLDFVVVVVVERATAVVLVEAGAEVAGDRVDVVLACDAARFERPPVVVKPTATPAPAARTTPIATATTCRRRTRARCTDAESAAPAAGGRGGPPSACPTYSWRPVETARVDQWLWAVRLYKTRTAATEACRGGHVRVNGHPAKAASPVRVGDRVTTRAHGWERVVEVARVVDKRVGPPEAAQCLVDHSPERPPDDDAVFERDAGTGRPTKRDRRKIDRLRR
jgi:ribosome-associated heat shock protein Hsp15